MIKCSQCDKLRSVVTTVTSVYYKDNRIQASPVCAKCYQDHFTCDICYGAGPQCPVCSDPYQPDPSWDYDDLIDDYSLRDAAGTSGDDLV